MEIKVTKTTHPAEKPDSSTLGFGKVFTDHMFIMDYSAEEGWHDARIVPFGPIALHPASTVLHYGVEIFEGLKAYRRADGKVQLFRPIENIRRMNRSAERLCLPQIPEEDAMQALTTFVTMEQDWTPSAPGTSLYIRPFMFGNDETLGVHAVKHATFVIILSPVGSYYKEGINPVGIMIEDVDVRAVRGGTGEAKCGGNYAASLRANKKAHDLGYSCEFYLDAKEKKYIDECGAANFFGIKNNTYITPKSSSILPSITNKSLMQLAEDLGIKVECRPVPEEELETFEEAGACGTAAVISPIQRIDDLENKKSYIISKDGKPGPVCTKLYNKLRAIQYGDEPDTHNWVTILD